MFNSNNIPQLITAAIAIAAIISPIITTCINNLHQKKMKLIELEMSYYQENILDKIKLYENYLTTCSKYIEKPNENNMLSFLEYANKMALNCSKDIYDNVKEINTFISLHQPQYAEKVINSSIDDFRKSAELMRKSNKLLKHK